MLPQHSSKSVEWYTPALYIKAVRRVFQSPITLDPASCAKANLIIQAENFYDQHDDGLRRPWFGKTFCNPPYGRSIDGISNQYLWSVKAVVEFEAGNVEEMIFLCNAATSERWYKRLVRKQVILLEDDDEEYEDEDAVA